MKLHFGLKIFLAVLILACVSYIIYLDGQPSGSKPVSGSGVSLSPVSTSNPSGNLMGNSSGVPSEPAEKVRHPVFDPSHVLSMDWSFRVRKVHCLPASCDPWSFKRRVAILSSLENPVAVTVAAPLGFVSFGLTDESRVALQGAYDDKGFVWQTGPFKDRGFLFASASDVKNIFMEGTEGLTEHKLSLCKADKLTDFGSGEVILDSSSLKLENGKGLVFSKEGKLLGPASSEKTLELMNQICHLQVSYYKPDEKQLKFENPVLTLRHRAGLGGPFIASFSREDSKGGSIYFLKSPAFKTSTIPFTSENLDQIASMDFKDFIEENFKYSKDMLDSKKTQQERLGAIREIKKLKSVQALPALRKIIFENTQIDLYRYEAVDALVEIGTYDAYKMIADRLAEVPQSGFQLRLARALAPALGEPFVSDEHTPEDSRREEVQNLLKEYKKHPPGR